MFYLMNEDNPVLTLECSESLGYTSFHTKARHNDYLPYGFTSPDEWIESRQIAKHRKQIRKMMREWELDNRLNFINFTHCTSLADSFWIKRTDSTLTWKDVNLYHNEFNDVVANMAFDDAGLYGKQLDTTTPELATSGSFEKCWKRTDKGIFLYKRGQEGAINVGTEPHSEKLTSDLLDAMQINHVPYELIVYHNKIASACPIFTKENEGFVTFAAYTGKRISNPKEIMDTIGSVTDENRFREMVVADAISLNVDRHQGNFGFMVDNATGKITGFAPLFDHNLSQLPGLMQNDDVDEYLAGQGPRIGDDFVRMARAVMTPQLKSTLINLKNFDYENPGFDYPDWKIETLNRLKDHHISLILGRGPTYAMKREPKQTRPLPDINEVDLSEGEDPSAPFTL
jgi:hypothetical protein